LTPDELTEALFVLPTDVDHGDRRLCVELEARGAAVLHFGLPILRRAHRRPSDLVRLAARLARSYRLVRGLQPELVYLTTSATYVTAAAARLARVPRVVGHKQEMWGTADSWMLMPFASLCHELIAISQPVLD